MATCSEDDYCFGGSDDRSDEKRRDKSDENFENTYIRKYTSLDPEYSNFRSNVPISGYGRFWPPYATPEIFEMMCIRCKATFLSYSVDFKRCRTCTLSGLCASGMDCPNSVHFCNRNSKYLCSNHFKAFSPTFSNYCDCFDCFNRCKKCSKEKVDRRCAGSNCAKRICESCYRCDTELCLKYSSCLCCQTFVDKDLKYECYLCKKFWCANCFKLFTAPLGGKSKYVCFKCIPQRKKLKNCKKVIDNAFQKFIGNYLDQYLCSDLVKLCRTFVCETNATR